MRQELGWPIVMTPFAQMVIAQAVMNVTGQERYNTIPDEVIRYALGPLRQAQCAHRRQGDGAHRVAAAHARAARRAADGGAVRAAPAHRCRTQRRGFPAARHHARRPGGCDAGRRPRQRVTTIRRRGRCWSCCTGCSRGATSTRSTWRSRASGWRCGAMRTRDEAHESGKRWHARAASGSRNSSGFMFDVDGTLLLSDRSLGGYELLPGAAETLDALAARGVPYRAAHQWQRLSTRRTGREAAQARAAGRPTSR